MGSSKTAWFPDISAKLKGLDVDYVIPNMPEGVDPVAKDWLNTIDAEVKKTNKPLVFVGHSLGTRAVLLYLEKYKPQTKAVFLVACFSNNLENGHRHHSEIFEDFFEAPINTQQLKSLVGKFVVLHSKDDSSIPFTQGEEMAKALEAELLTFDDRDHFSAPENAPIILETLRKSLNF